MAPVGGCDRVTSIRQSKGSEQALPAPGDGPLQCTVSAALGKHCKQPGRAKQQISSQEAAVAEPLDVYLSTWATLKGREPKLCEGTTLPSSVENISSHSYMEVEQKAETEKLKNFIVSDSYVTLMSTQEDTQATCRRGLRLAVHDNSKSHVREILKIYQTPVCKMREVQTISLKSHNLQGSLCSFNCLSLIIYP